MFKPPAGRNSRLFCLRRPLNFPDGSCEDYSGVISASLTAQGFLNSVFESTLFVSCVIHNGNIALRILLPINIHSPWEIHDSPPKTTVFRFLLLAVYPRESCWFHLFYCFFLPRYFLNLWPLRSINSINITWAPFIIKFHRIMPSHYEWTKLRLSPNLTLFVILICVTTWQFAGRK